MTEQIISFETAKLAKGKRFSTPTLCFYFEDGVFHENFLRDTYGYYGEAYEVYNSELIEDWNTKWKTSKNGDRCLGCSSKNYLETFSAPTQSLLQKWLRDIHKMYISIDIEDKNQFMYYVLDFSYNNQYIQRESIYPTYEEALEAALIHALNLI